jgi:proteic killer suppression protein
VTLVSVLFNDRCDPEPMIVSFRHKGLARLYQRAERRGVAADLLPKVERVLARLDVVTNAGQMDLPGWKLHPLKGKWKGFWSVWVSGNWRIIFRFTGTDAADVDLVDYH